MIAQDPTAGLTDQERADFWFNRNHKKIPYLGHRLVFRLTGGRLGGTRRGVTCGLLTTTGRRTGRTRTAVPIMFLADGDRFLIVAANSGFDPAPAWYLNLLANSSASFRSAKATFPVVARELSADEREASWEKVVRFNPLYGAFQACTDRTIAVLSLQRAAQ